MAKPKTTSGTKTKIKTSKSSLSSNTSKKRSALTKANGNISSTPQDILPSKKSKLTSKSLRSNSELNPESEKTLLNEKQSDVEILDSAKMSSILDRLTKRTWSLYRSSPPHNLLPQSQDLGDPSFSSKHGFLIQQAVKKLRAFLNAEVPGIELPASSSGEGRLSVDSVSGWVAALPPLSGENQHLIVTGFDITLESRVYSNFESNRRNELFESVTSEVKVLKNKIQVVLVTNYAKNFDLPFSLILTKGLSDGVNLSLQWLASYCDSRVSQFYLAPHQLQPLWTTSLASILYFQDQTSELEANYPSAELKFQFDPRTFPNQDLELMTINVPWPSLFDLWKELGFEANVTSGSPTREQFHSWGLQIQAHLENHIMRCSGISASTLALRRIGTPILVAQCYGKFKLLAGFSSSYYVLLLRLLFRQSQ